MGGSLDGVGQCIKIDKACFVECIFCVPTEIPN